VASQKQKHGVRDNLEKNSGSRWQDPSNNHLLKEGKEAEKGSKWGKNSGVVLCHCPQYNTHKETINQCKMMQQQNK